MDSLNPNYNPFEGKKKGAHYTLEQIAFIKELVDLGWSANKIATTYKIDSRAIRKRIKNNDWSCAEKNRNIQLSNKELQEIKSKVEQGIDKQLICDEYSISMFSLMMWLISTIRSVVSMCLRFFCISRKIARMASV